MLIRREQKSVQKEDFIANVIELLDNAEEFKHDHCPVTDTVPLLPFRIKDLSKLQKFTPHTFELQSLLSHLLVYKNTKHPINRNPLSIIDIGTELVPNVSLIEKVDAFLAKHNITRQDLLDFHNLSPFLYLYYIFIFILVYFAGNLRNMR